MGSMTLFYTKDVTVKLLPFDNKSELQIVADLPEAPRSRKRRGY